MLLSVVGVGGECFRPTPPNGFSDYIKLRDWACAVVWHVPTREVGWCSPARTRSRLAAGGGNRVNVCSACSIKAPRYFRGAGAP